MNGVERHEEFEHIWNAQSGEGAAMFLDHVIDAPKSDFLQFLVDTKNIVLHGSRDPSLDYS